LEFSEYREKEFRQQGKHFDDISKKLEPKKSTKIKPQSKDTKQIPTLQPQVGKVGAFMGSFPVEHFQNLYQNLSTPGDRKSKFF